MRDDLPFDPTGRRDSGAGDNGSGTAAGGLLTESGQPRDTDLGACRTSTHQMPESGTVVALLASPVREQGETVVERKIARAAANVPCSGGIWGSRAPTSV